MLAELVVVLCRMDIGGVGSVDDGLGIELPNERPLLSPPQEKVAPPMSNEQDDKKRGPLRTLKVGDSVFVHSCAPNTPNHVVRTVITMIPKDAKRFWHYHRA